MFNRNILIVDDEETTETISIKAYKRIFNFLKEQYAFNYNLNFIWKKSIKEALDILGKKEQVFDVLLIDYSFPNEVSNRKGVDLVKNIRRYINKRCKIVFYTMHALHEIEPEEYLELINNDVFRLVPKDGQLIKLKYVDSGHNTSDQLIVEALIDALENLDPVSIALEKYIANFSNIIDDLKISIEEKDYSIDEVLTSIRLFEHPGNKFVDNLLEMSIIEYLRLE
ncbi:hypothetical protein MOC97_16050 [Bacillus atrophaeus]|uniref:hypothetical protein n=1 Tax=Bacillus atrophaeus TaxID=1452 RepID=UPI002280329A|nr:hypothetical protein [Bacillus atrophaeus]MCY8486951.1 hypothetical protein [Bacillus atrophaeus]